MDNEKEIIKKFQKNNFNLSLINDTIIEFSKEPKDFHFEIVDFLLNKLDKEDLPKININLIYLLGELGKIKKLEQKYYQYLYKTYFSSDRWIRSEILKVLEKNIEIVKSNDDFIELLASALSEDYEMNNDIALKIINQLDLFPISLFKNFLTLLNKEQSELKENIDTILVKHLNDESLIFNTLNQKNYYQILKPNGLRLILQSFIPSINKIASLQKLIQNSDWNFEIKSMYLDEIRIILSLANRI